MRFEDRRAAGRALAQVVGALDLVDPIVLALPRGGVPVAAEVAAAVGAPLDVVVARKVGAPGHPELGIGAIAEGGVVVTTESVRALGLSPARFEALAERERGELDRRVARYRGGRPLPELAGHDVVVVDDGLATGVTAEAALRALRHQEPRRLVLAVPVGAPDTLARLGALADHVASVHAPADLQAVGLWYVDFTQTTDGEVADLLARHRRPGEGQR